MREGRRTEEPGVEHCRTSSGAGPVDRDPQLKTRAPRCLYARNTSMKSGLLPPSGCLLGQQPRVCSQATLPRRCRLTYPTMGRWTDSSPAIGPSFLGSSAALGSSGAQSRYAMQPTLNPLLRPPMPGRPPSPSLAPPHSLRTRLFRQGAKNFCCAKLGALPGFRFTPCLRPEPARTDGSQGRPKGPATNKRRSS